jgi:hypothetical protein
MQTKFFTAPTTGMKNQSKTITYTTAEKHVLAREMK